MIGIEWACMLVWTSDDFGVIASNFSGGNLRNCYCIALCFCAIAFSIS